jgi:hypothetical protein
VHPADVHLAALVAGGVLGPAHARAVAMWLDDLATAGRPRRDGLLPERQRRCRARDRPDIMVAACRQRLAAVERRTGGRDGPWFRALWHIAWLQKPPEDAAADLGLSVPAVTAAMRVAAADLAIVYQVRAA